MSNSAVRSVSRLFALALQAQALREPVKPIGPATINPPAKLGRNETCSCGSGLKFKRCCRRKQ